MDLTTVRDESATLVREQAGAILEPATLVELRALAKDAADSGFFGARTPQQAVITMLTGRDLGLSYSQSLRAFHVIEVPGRAPRLTLSADGMIAVCLAKRGVCEYFRVVESDESKATVEAKRFGDPARRVTFTLEEAKRAGLVKEGSNWQKWPARMCLARSKSFLARDLFADLLLGLYDPDELRDALQTNSSAVPEVATALPRPSPGRVRTYLALIADASNLEALFTVGEEMSRAKRDGDLAFEEALELSAVYAERKRALGPAKT